jgi:DNA polymerase-1
MSGFSYYSFHQDPHLRVITTPDGLQEAENILKAGPKSFAYDTETNGLAWWRGDHICGAAFATRPTGGNIEAFYIPYRHVTGQHQITPDHVIAFQKQFLEDPSYEVIAHNIKFDEHMARQDGLTIQGPRVDTMIEARLFHEDRSAGLKSRLITDLGDPNAQLYADMLDLDIVRMSKALGMNKTAYLKEFGYSGLDIWLAGQYASYDVVGTWKLHEFYEDAGVRAYYSKSPRMVPGREFRGIYDIEMKLTEVLCDVERVGVPLDIDRLHQLYAFLLKEREIAEGTFFKETGLEYFNLGSDDELRDRLLGFFKVPLQKTTKSGALAVDSEVLGKAAQAFPVLNHVLRWKEVDKKISTYTLSLLGYCDENGVLHGNFQQVGTNTGRLACRDPNLQNQPSDDSSRKKANNGVDPESVKQIFGIQRHPNDPIHFLFHRGKPGMAYRLYVDYSQIELRVLGHYSQDHRMCQTYRDGGDIHDAVENAVFGTGKNTPEGDINRRKAKVINFGLSYCMTPQGFARQIPEVTEEEAQMYFDEYNKKFPRVGAFRQEFWSYIRMNACQFQNMFGRTRHIAAIVSVINSERRRAERQAIATLIQGTAAELTKESMVRIYEWLNEEGLSSKQVLTVHDEVQLDGPMEEFAYVARGVIKIMTDFPDFSVPVEVGTEWSVTNWAEKKELNMALVA